MIESNTLQPISDEQFSNQTFTEVDRDYVPGLLCIRDMEGDAKAFAAMDMTFSTPSAGGQEIHLSNR